MNKIKRMGMAMLMAVVVLFGGVFSFFGEKSVKAKALVDYAYGRTDLIYYFCDSYPTFPNTSLRSIVLEELLVYDIQKVDEDTFDTMVSSGYFTGLGANSMFILDLKTFSPETSVLCSLFCQIKSEDRCKTVLVTNNVSSSGVVFSELWDCVDEFYSSTCRLQAFAQEIVATQMLDVVGNGMVNGTTFLLDNIIDNPEDYAGVDLNTLRDADLFLDYFITELLGYAEPDPALTSATDEDVLTNSGIRILLHTGENRFVDVISGEINIEKNSDNFQPTEAQDNAVVGFSNIDTGLGDEIKKFQDNVDKPGVIPEYLMPVHILEVEPIAYAEDGILAFIFSGADSGSGEFLTILQDLYFSS